MRRIPSEADTIAVDRRSSELSVEHRPKEARHKPLTSYHKNGSIGRCRI
jgi:hypothetical protein